MNTEEIITGFNGERDSLLARLEEPISQYVLCRMKLDQLRQRRPEASEAERQMVDNMNLQALDIFKALTVE